MTENCEFEAFVREHQDLVFSVALRLLQNSADAQDVAQEVFLRAYRDFDKLCSNPSARAWLRCVARNLCLNHLTRYRARWTLFTDFFHREEEGTPDDLVPHFAGDALSSTPSEDHELVHAALFSLPEKQRVPLVLFHYEEMSYEEIARVLKTSLSQIKTDIHRGREALRAKILRFRRQSDGGLPAGTTTHSASLASLPPDSGISHKLSEAARAALGLIPMTKP
jgi:RNA polymerase sigma-70 factor (ECF subfamily)